MRKIVLFDMDGTLTPARKQIEPDMIRALKFLEKEYEIGIVTGSDFEYVRQQIKPALDIGGIRLSTLHIFPCNGTKYYKWENNKFECQYSADMISEVGEENYQYLLQTLFSGQLLISLRHNLPYTGTFFHYRGSMLNWCPIGRSAKDREREAWVAADNESKIRTKYLDFIKEAIDKKKMKLQVALGGATSFDIFPEGWDKTYVLKHLEAFKEIIFIGDACEEGGNDHEIYTLLKDGDDTQSYSTTDPLVTAKIVELLILGDSA